MSALCIVCIFCIWDKTQITFSLYTSLYTFFFITGWLYIFIYYLFGNMSLAFPSSISISLKWLIFSKEIAVLFEVSTIPLCVNHGLHPDRAWHWILAASKEKVTGNFCGRVETTQKPVEEKTSRRDLVLNISYVFKVLIYLFYLYLNLQYFYKSAKETLTCTSWM